jgi:hypothetical protein
MISRRDFVTSSGTALAAALASTSALAATSILDPGAVDLSTGLSRDKFRALLQQNFNVATKSSGVVVLTLVELREYLRGAGVPPLDSFTLRFQGLPSPKLGAGLYTLEHGSAGKALLRLEPVRVTADRALYRAQCCLFG